MARRDTRPDPKEAALAGARCLNPHPEQVTDPEFLASDFFDARDAVQVKYENSYVLHGEVPFWGFLPQHGEETQPPVEVFYALKRPRKSDFGDRPIPGGVARLYDADSAGGLQLVGEARLDHTPPGNDLKLNAGTAFDITAR